MHGHKDFFSAGRHRIRRVPCLPPSLPMLTVLRQDLPLALSVASVSLIQEEGKGLTACGTALPKQKGCGDEQGKMEQAGARSGHTTERA